MCLLLSQRSVLVPGSVSGVSRQPHASHVAGAFKPGLSGGFPAAAQRRSVWSSALWTWCRAAVRGGHTHTSLYTDVLYKHSLLTVLFDTTMFCVAWARHVHTFIARRLREWHLHICAHKIIWNEDVCICTDKAHIILRYRLTHTVYLKVNMHSRVQGWMRLTFLKRGVAYSQ